MAGRNLSNKWSRARMRITLSLTLLLAVVWSACQKPSVNPIAGASVSHITGITWKLRSFSTISGEEKPVPATATVTLLLTDSARLGGRGGCNSYGGPYQIHDSLLSVTGPMFRTKMSCDAIATEDEYLDALAKSVRYWSDGRILLIYYGDGNHILSFAKM
ncbi:MAG: hypothetical protein JWQ98_1960 [Chlorobi bacterium]|nr:hypothetical protein [Chlorobiota bacterium]